MRALFRGAFVLLLVGAALGNPTTRSPKTLKNKSASPAANLDRDVPPKTKLLTKKVSNCPRDCICSPSTRSILAKCNRLEVGTQVFGEDVSDLIVENSKVPVVLGDNIFKKLGLTRVMNIKIAECNVVSISPLAFDGLSDLFSVNLTANNIERIAPKVFSDNPMLNLLSLSGNPLKIAPRFIKSTSLQELDLSDCGIENLPSDAFGDLKSLMYINLSKNKLQALDAATFSNLPSLEEIELSNNNIQSLPKDIFAKNNELSSLYIGNNPLGSFNNLYSTELLALNVENASIKILKNSSFTGMSYLTTLTLSGNGLEVIEPLAFDTLGDLNFLDLSNNNLSSISDEIIKDSSYLDVFKIANNTRLKELPPNGFLVSDIDFNIYLFDASGCSIEKITAKMFKNMPLLTQINLSRNQITTVDNAFETTQQLVELDLSHNKIEILDISTFARNDNLAKLNLAGNPLVSISVELFLNNPSLTRLDVSHCQLYMLWDIKTNNTNALSKLHYLDASHNQITTIHPEVIKNLKQLETFDISKNPLECNVDFEQLMKWLGENSVSPTVKDTVISNINKNAKIIDSRSDWEFLAKEVCGTKAMVKDDNDEDSDDDDDNDDDDDDASKDSKDNDEDDDDDDDDDEDDKYDDIETDKDMKKIDDKGAKDANGDDVDDESEGDDYYEDDYDTDPAAKKSEDKKEKKLKLNMNKTVDEIIIKEIPKKVEIEFEKTDKKLMNSLLFKDKNGGIVSDKDSLDGIDSFIDNEAHPVNMDELLSDEDATIMMNENILQSSAREDWAFYDQLLKIIIAHMVVIIVILLLVYFIRRRHLRRNDTILTISGNHHRMKKDCGLVYQQLTEDLTGPKTPVLNKHHLITNITRENNPFQNTKVMPEAV